MHDVHAAHRVMAVRNTSPAKMAIFETRDRRVSRSSFTHTRRTRRHPPHGYMLPARHVMSHERKNRQRSRKIFPARIALAYSPEKGKKARSETDCFLSFASPRPLPVIANRRRGYALEKHVRDRARIAGKRGGRRTIATFEIFPSGNDGT